MRQHYKIKPKIPHLHKLSRASAYHPRQGRAVVPTAGLWLAGDRQESRPRQLRGLGRMRLLSHQRVVSAMTQSTAAAAAPF